MKNPRAILAVAGRELSSFVFWKNLLIMLAGLMVGAAAVYYFLMPSNIIIGTVSGIAMVLNALIPALKVSTWVLLLNVVLVVLAAKLLVAVF